MVTDTINNAIIILFFFSISFSLCTQYDYKTVSTAAIEPETASFFRLAGFAIFIVLTPAIVNLRKVVGLASLKLSLI